VKNDKQTYRRPREAIECDHVLGWSSTPDKYWQKGSSHDKPPTGFIEPDVGTLPDVECDVGRVMNDEWGIMPFRSAYARDRMDRGFPSDVVGISFRSKYRNGLNAQGNDRWLEEVRHRCSCTKGRMLRRYKMPPALEKDECSNITSTQHSIAFHDTRLHLERIVTRSPMLEEIQMARSKLSEPDGSQVNKLSLESGETHLNYLKCGYPAAIHSIGSDASRKIQNWYPESRWHRFVWSIPRDSLSIETVRLVLQRWRGVCSFSQTMRSIGAMKKVVWCTTFAPKNIVDHENDSLKSYSMVYTYDDITIT
jgi:hypothetical protein